MGDDLDFRVLFEHSPDVLLVLLPDAPRYTMVAATRARLEATCTTLEQTIGRGLFDLFPDNPDDPGASGTANLRASLDRVCATRAPDTMAVQKYDIRGPDGTFQSRYWSPKNLPVLSKTGELLYIFHRVEDVTGLIRATEAGAELRERTEEMEREVIRRSRELAITNRELRDANAKLGELDAAKTAFFSNVSHEFRTPLTLMLSPLEDGLADTVEPLGPRQRERASMALANAMRLLKLVNALLDFSRIEAGRMTVSYAPLDVAKFSAELAGMFQSLLHKAGLELTIDCPPLSEPVWVDREMWEKIVPNLVSNAFKFTLSGGIAVKVRSEESCVALEVRDTGIGIPAGELPKIFDRFHRVAGAEGRTHEGTGIGLSLVRELVELHGGKVGVTSEVGRGTTFRVEIPKGTAHLAPAAVSFTPAARRENQSVATTVAEASRWGGARGPDRGPTVQTGPRARVLVVDDNPDLRAYMAELLAPIYEVTAAEDGLAAVGLARENPPDIVLSDVMMPRLDGFGLLRELRADSSTASIPVILLSARAGEESAIDGLDAGADDYLAKPFSSRELLARVRAHVELTRARRAWIAELERTNRELDAFSYSVSHDLRAPLRAVGGFTRMIAEDYGSHLDERGHNYVERICAGVEHMGTLIDALLGLARIARAPLAKRAVDLSTLAGEVAADLARAHPLRKVAVDIAPGMVAQGDRPLLGVVLVNLIGNAWKFTAKTPEARVAVGRLPAEEPTFFVRDNGAGFDMTHASRLFAPFQRLHGASDFEGTGIGLATSQRVVARHGGRIWAEAAVGKGATFCFSLPERAPKGALPLRAP